MKTLESVYGLGMGRYEKYGHREVATTVPIPRFRVLVHPKQTWTFPLHHISIKVPKCTKYEI